MSSRTALLLTFTILTIALLVAIAVWTPWTTLPLHGVPPCPPTRRATSRPHSSRARTPTTRRCARRRTSPSLSAWSSRSCSVSRPLGARIVSAVAAPLGGGWGWRVLLGTIALTAIGRLVVLPFDARAEAALRRFGLSTQTWASWGVDVAKGYGVGLVLTLLMLFGVVGLARWSPQWWWSFGAAFGALLVVVVSFAYPVVVEPVFNSFTPMPAGPLRTSLLSMAAQDGVPARDVLVADASRRTNSLNAYVSGFGATRRIVVYDTLLKDATPDEVRLIVAHELGHAKAGDVLWGTFVGALGVAVTVCLLGLLLRWPWLLDRAGVGGPGTPERSRCCSRWWRCSRSSPARPGPGVAADRGAGRPALAQPHARAGRVRGDAATAGDDQPVRPRPVAAGLRPVRDAPDRPATHRARS